MRALNYRERLFALFYCGEAKGNARLAAEMAGYSPGMGTTLLRRPMIAMLVQRKAESAAMSADEVLARLSDMASYDPDDFLTVTQEEDELDDEGNIKKKGRQRISFDYQKAKSRGKLHCIKKFEVLPDGGIRFEPHDAQSALEKLAKYHALFRDKIEVHHVTNDTTVYARITQILGGIAVLEGAGSVPAGSGESVSRALCDHSERGDLGAGSSPQVVELEVNGNDPEAERPSSDLHAS